MNNFNKFNNFKLINKFIKITGTTSKVFEINAIGNLKTFKLINARYIKDFPINIIAEADLRKNYDIRFVYGDSLQEDRAYIFDKTEKAKIATFCRNANNLYVLDEQDKNEIIGYINMERQLNLEGFNNEQIKRMKIAHEMHKRMAYLSTQNMESIIRYNGIAGKFNLGEIDEKDINNYRNHLHSKICTGCRLAKMYSEPAKTIDYKSIPQQPGVMHADIMHITYDEGILHYLVAIDQQCAMTFAVQIKNSEDNQIALATKLIRQCYKRYGHELITIHFDNEPIINNGETKGEIHSEGSDTIFRTPGSHVRRAENVIKLIKTTYRAILVGLDYACPCKLYPYVIRWAVQAINLTSKSGNAVMAPWTIFTKQKLDFENQFRAKFGDIILTRANSNDEKRVKSNKPLTTFAIILCHDENIRGTYVCIDLNTRRIIKRRQFKIHENLNTIIESGIKSIGKASANTTFGHVSECDDIVPTTADERMPNKAECTKQNTQGEFIYPENNNHEIPEPAHIDNIEMEFTEPDVTNDLDVTNDPDDISDNASELTNESDCKSLSEDDDSDQIDYIGKNENIKPNGYDEDIDPIGDSEDENDETEHINDSMNNENPSRRSNREWKPSQKLLETFAVAAVNDDHLTLKQAVQLHGETVVDEAIMKEINNMFDKKVWIEATYEPNIIIVPSQLILKAKYKANGNFDKLKARLIALGNRQKLPENFLWTDVESPTAAISNIMTIFQLIPKLKWKLNIVDIAAAYLHAEIDGDIYMRLNEEISNIIRTKKNLPGKGPMLVKLLKCIYGLKQSGRRWFELLKATFINFGLKQSEIDRCIFYSNSTIIAIYVDDIVIASIETDRVISHLENSFGEITKQLGPEYSFLGMKILANENSLKISQAAYIEKITQGVTELGINRIPHRANFKPRIEDNAKEQNKCKTMQAMYLATRTRPDILYNTSILATNTYDCKEDIERLFRYLKQSREYGITYTDAPINLHCYCDASFMSHIDRKSHTGFAIFLDNCSGAIMAKSKKQQSIAQSSTEAELIALFDAARHLLLLKDLLEEIGIRSNTPTVFEDNKAVISIVANNAIPKGNSKFIERKYLQTREWIKNERMNISFTSSETQVADALTKAKYGDDFIKFQKHILGPK